MIKTIYSWPTYHAVSYFFLVLWAFCLKLGRHIADSIADKFPGGTHFLSKIFTAKSERSMMNPLAPPLCLPPPKYHMKIKNMSKIFFFKAFATGKWNKKVVWLLDFFHIWKSQKKEKWMGVNGGIFGTTHFWPPDFFFIFWDFCLKLGRFVENILEKL